MYRDTDDATVAGIAADLGISHGSLTSWLKNAGIPIRRHGTAVHRGQTPVNTRVARFRTEVAHLRAEKTKLETERDILRSSAKYLAGETNRSSYYVRINAADTRAARAAAGVELAEKIRAVRKVDTPTGGPGHRRDHSRTIRRPTDQ